MRINRKFIHNSITGLLLVAPLVYLFGSLFTGLNGAHGEQIFAEPVYVEEYIEVDDFGVDGDYKLSINGMRNYLASPDYRTRYFTFPYVFRDINRNYVNFFNYDGFRYMTFGVEGGSYSDIASYNPTTDVYREHQTAPWVLYVGVSASSFVSFLADFEIEYTLSRLMSVPSSSFPENQGAFSDYVFGQFFARDNFVSKIGEDAISETPHGFVPFAQFLSFIDGNMLHLGDTQVGLMAYGYFYWCAHVLLLVLVFDLTTFFIQWVSRIARSAEDKSEVGL